MKTTALLLALAAATASPALSGETVTARLLVEEMTACPSCPYIVQSVLSRVDGVQGAEAVFETGIATVTYDDAVTGVDDLLKALAEYGYTSARPAPEG